jgi:hypothetical protein
MHEGAAMLEGAALLALYLAFALLHAAEPRRRPSSWPALAPAWDRRFRIAALACLACGTGLWARAEGLAAALLVALSALTAFATAVVLLAPVAPRLVWGLAVACVPAALALTLWGVCRG